MFRSGYVFVFSLVAIFLAVGAVSAQVAGGGSVTPAGKSKTKKRTTVPKKSTPKPQRKTTSTSKTKREAPVQRDATYYVDFAAYRCGENDLDCKIDNFTKAINLTPKDAELYYRRALIFHRQRSYNSAVADYTKVIELDRSKAWAAYNNRAWTLCQMGLFDRALADADRALELRPNYAAALDTRGNAYMGKGDLVRAKADFDRAVKLAPNDPEMYKSRAILYRKTGKTALAQLDEQKFRELGGKQ